MKKNERGASMIWVLCLTLIVFIIGGSILTAGTMASVVAIRARDAKNCAHYTKTLAEVLNDDIAAFTLNDANPWYVIAQSVYDVKMLNKDNQLVLNGVDLTVDLSRLSLSSAPVTQTNILVTSQIVRVAIPYRAEETEDVPGVNDDGEEIIETIIVVPEQDEVASVSFGLTVELNTTIGSQTHVIFLRYAFRGSTTGAGNGIGRITSGEYEYLGAFDTP